MQEIVLNNELILSYPDSFHVMTEEERSGLQFMADGPGTCLSDPERHLMISVGWRTVNGLAAMLLGEKEIARNMEAQAKLPMQQYGYHLEGFVSGRIGDRSCEGFHYSYTVDGKGMEAQSLVTKKKKTIYYLHFYARAETWAQGLSEWKTILGDARWK